MLHHCLVHGDKACKKQMWAWLKMKDFKKSGEEIARDVSKRPRTSARMIVADLASSGVDVSRNTVVRALHRGGLQGHHLRRVAHQTQTEVWP